MSKYSQTKLLRKAIQREIQSLKRIELRTANEKHVEQLIAHLLGHGHIQRILNVRSPKAFRVRINEKKELFENVEDLWWPRPEKVKVKRGRCNREDQPVFYYSDSEETAIIEKQPDEGDIITVLTSELIDPTKMPNLVSIGVHEFTGASNPNYGGTPPARDQKLQELLRREGLSKITPLLEAYLVGEFLKDVSANDEYEYKTTSSIGRLLTEKPEVVTEEGKTVNGAALDGIAYPSIRCDLLGANVALETNAADKLYRPVSCVVYRVEEANPKYPYTVSKLGWSKSIDDKGKIEWEIPKADKSAGENPSKT